LNAPAELSSQGSGNLIEVGAELLAQQLAEARVIVDPPDDPADAAFPLQTVQGGINGRPMAKVQEVAWRECPSST
jgi:hypothetical protein